MVKCTAVIFFGIRDLETLRRRQGWPFESALLLYGLPYSDTYIILNLFSPVFVTLGFHQFCQTTDGWNREQRIRSRSRSRSRFRADKRTIRHPWNQFPRSCRWCLMQQFGLPLLSFQRGSQDRISLFKYFILTLIIYRSWICLLAS